MEDANNTINEVMVKLYNDIISIEEKAVITGEFKDISNNDMHIIDTIGIGTPKNMSSIARELSVTVGTLTIAINSLVKKGYVIRTRSEKDRRVVYISLSDKGIKAYNHHYNFHNEMIKAVTKDFTPDEINLVIKSLTNLVDFFKSKL